MDNDKIIENSDYQKTRKISWFDKNVEKLEILILILIFISGIFVGFAVLYNTTKVNKLTLVCPEYEEKVEYLEISIVNSNKDTVYNDILKINSTFKLTNQTAGNYYLNGMEEALFTTTTNTNTIDCTIKDSFESISCSVSETEVQQQTTEQTAEQNNG